MAKVELDDVANLANTTSAQSTINNNSDTIETAFDNTLSRDGSSPNSMAADLDMDSNEILNLKAPTSNASAARLQDVLDQTTEDATSKPATAITITDGGGYYTSGTVEGALQEVGDYTQVTASPTELNKLDGVTASTSEINTLDGITATTAELNNADESATSGGGFILGPTSGSDQSALGFDTWRTPSSSRATFILVQATVQTDGVTNGRVNLLVDDSGGTTPDFTLSVAYIDSIVGNTGNSKGSFSCIIPAGASYQIQNATDPNTVNSLDILREYSI